MPWRDIAGGFGKVSEKQKEVFAAVKRKPKPRLR
jgi:hypothetical protein